MPPPDVARNTRAISGVEAARRDFDGFPQGARDELLDAMTAVSEGVFPTIAKALTGLGSGVTDMAPGHRGDAFRVVCALRIDDDIWVVHAFQKKSKSGIATPKQKIDLIRDRLKRLKEMPA
jgi:phage-related protein